MQIPSIVSLDAKACSSFSYILTANFRCKDNSLFKSYFRFYDGHGPFFFAPHAASFFPLTF